MGTFSSFSYSNTATIWPTTTDEASQEIRGEPYTVRCSFQGGGRASRDNAGNEFIPTATFWMETDRAPEIQWWIALGTHTGAPPSDAQLIRVANPQDVSLFQAGSLTDYVVHV